MKRIAVYKELDQTAAPTKILQTGMCKSLNCDSAFVIFDTPVSAPVVKIYGNSMNISNVLLHTESAIAAQKIVEITSAGAFSEIYAELTDTAGDKCHVEIICTWRSLG